MSIYTASESHTRYFIDRAVFKNLNVADNVNAFDMQQDTMKNLSEKFTSERTIGYAKMAITQKPNLNVLTLQREDGYTKMAIADKPLKVVTLDRGDGITKTVVNHIPVDTVILPTITFQNDVFEEKVDQFLNDFRI